MTPKPVFSKDATKRPGHERNKRSTLLIDALELLGSNPSLGLEDLSRKLGVCTAYFRETLTAKAGISPMRMKENIRLCIALRQMLTDNDLGRIGRQAGYQSYKAFQVAFKRRLGLSPAALQNLKSRRRQDAVKEAIDRIWTECDDSIRKELARTFEEIRERKSSAGPE